MYAIILGAPAGGDLVTACFLVASVVHFAAELGCCGSVLMHFILACMYFNDQELLATETMLWYLSCVHVPIHYIRIINESTLAAYASVFVATSATIAHALHGARHSQRNVLKLGHFHQRLVIAHVLSTHVHDLYRN
jgi:hypothetical protein